METVLAGLQKGTREVKKQQKKLNKKTREGEKKEGSTFVLKLLTRRSLHFKRQKENRRKWNVFPTFVQISVV